MTETTAVASSETHETKIPLWVNILIPLLLTICGSFAVLEVGLRQFYQLIPLEVCASDFILGNYYCQPYFEYDKPIRYAYKYQPNLYLEGLWDPADPFLGDAGLETRPSERSDAFNFVLQTDEMGFPNSQSEWQAEYDVIVTGDSFTIRTAPRTWIELLEEQSEKSILTLGAPSWGTLNQLEAVRQFGLDKNPDWVFLLYFEGNDVLNIGQYLDKQASGLDWREYDLQDVPWYRRLVTYHMLRYWLGIGAETTAEEPVRYRYPVTVNTEAGRIEAVLKDTHLLPISADYETLARSDEFQAIGAALLELDALVTAQGGRFTVVYIPSKAHVYWSRIWDETDVNNILERTVTVTLSDGDNGRLEWKPQYLSYDTFNANHDDHEQLFVDFAAENGLEMINLTPIFWQRTIAEGETYHYADSHWNQFGNQIVADVLTAYMAEAEGE